MPLDPMRATSDCSISEPEPSALPFDTEERFRLLCQAAFDGMIIVQDGVIVEASPPFAEMCGYEVEELAGQPLTRLITSAARDRILKPESPDAARSYDTIARRKDGSTFFIELDSAAGGCGQHIFAARNITRRHESEELLAESERRYRDLAGNASDVIGILDPAGIIRYHSPSLERSLGLPPGELTGSRLIDHVHPDDSAAVEEFIARQGAGLADGATIQLRLKQRSGSDRFFEMIARNLVREGNVRSIVVNARDVTGRELLRRQLEQANRVAGLGRLAATMAHEFNNVLMGMQPFAELLQRPNPSAATLARCGAHIASSIQRGKRVALDILRFTQPASPVLKRLNLAAWWRQLAPEMSAQIESHIAFEATFPEDVEVQADAAQLAQVFGNLINNAREAMSLAGRLTISVRQPQARESFSFGIVPDPSSLVQISVADTGTGIAPDIIDHVFDPLFTTKESGGTGLGLAAAHQTITRHGGYIFVESERGAGTTVHVFLPRAATARRRKNGNRPHQVR